MTWFQCCAIGFLLLAGYAGAQQKIGVIDIQRAILEVEEGKAARTRLQALAEAKQKEVDKEQEALRKEKDLLDKQGSAMNETARNERSAELQKKVMELSQKFEKSRSELASKEQEESRTIFAKLQPIVAAISEREGMDLVLDRQAVVHARPALDITNEVIRTFNSQAGQSPEGAQKKAASPKQAAPAPTGQSPKKK